MESALSLSIAQASSNVLHVTTMGVSKGKSPNAVWEGLTVIEVSRFEFSSQTVRTVGPGTFLPVRDPPPTTLHNTET